MHVSQNSRLRSFSLSLSLNLSTKIKQKNQLITLNKAISHFLRKDDTFQHLKRRHFQKNINIKSKRKIFENIFLEKFFSSQKN